MALLPGARLGALRLVARMRANEAGEIWRARGESGATVVVQTLRRSGAGGLRPAVGLAHPNLRALHDLGSVEEFDYLVLETLSGETLAERLGRSSLPLDETLDVAAGIAAGLEALHRAGVVHGNLDPGKILLSDGPPRLVDYGLGRTLRSFLPAAPRGVVAEALGPAFGYLSPEEDRGESADARSDVFSFGAILDEMVSGPLPVAPEAARVLPELRKVIGRCLAVDPAARYASGSELRSALESIVAEKRRLESASRARAAERRRRIAAGWMIAAGLGLAAFVERFRSRAKPGVLRPEPTSEVSSPPRVANSDAGEDPPPAAERASEGQPATTHGAGQ